MSIESPKIEKEKLSREPIIERAGVVFDDFDVSFFNDAEELAGDGFEENLTETKKMVDDILGSEWKIDDKLRVYLFTDENQYKEYLKRNFPKIPDDMATFDRKTESVFRCGKIPENEEFRDYCRAQMFSGVGHEMAHLHPFFGGVGNKASKGKWEQEMICVFVEDKVRTKTGSDLMQKMSMENAKKELEKFRNKEGNFSLEAADTNWKNFYSLERLFYPWLEKRYGMEKLRQLWTVLFKDKKGISESLKEIYGEDIDDLEKQFEEGVEKAQNYEELVK
ncbi:MAG: hypothetical protein Q8N59_02340 [bacterium]|nr:hypothetical protein [bacterium]